jgi:RimJ/RimL family protein N-acetyltransferase
LLLRAKEILQTEGLLPLLRRGFVFLIGYLYRYESYYLYEHTLEEKNEADFLPKVQDFTFKIVATNKQADELAAAGLDLSSHVINARQKLNKGAIAFCFFIDGELAHLGLVAMNEEAKNCFDSLPYRVDYAGKQACTGGTWTHPKYQGRGLMVYGYFKRFEFLREQGMKSSRNGVEVGNIASQKAHARFGPKVYARARYLKVFGWKSLKETPIIGIPDR